MTEPIKILYIYNSAFDHRLVLDALEKDYGVFEITETKTRQEFERLLAEG